MDGGDQKLLDDVTQYGWHVVKVMEDDEAPGFAYSIGLKRNFGHPELMVFGLELDLMHRLINGAGDDIRTGKQYRVGEEYDGIVEGYRCAFRAVPRRWFKRYLGYALSFYRDECFDALQCFWPDKQGAFPWEPSFNPNWKRKQPLLYAY